MNERLTDARFQTARRRVLSDDISSQGIGTLSEKTLHRMLKLTVELDEGRHEQKVDGKVVDVVLSDGHLVEIQTRSLAKLCPKLEVLLPQHRVTVLYPLPREKSLVWIDPDTGEITERRKSPKHATAFDSIVELFRIGSFLGHAHLRICLVFLDVEEYRYLSGRGLDRKRGSRRIERMANRLCEHLTLATPDDYRRTFLPPSLGAAFTVKEYAKAARLKPRWAYTAIRLLMQLGVVAHTDTRGREFIYCVT